jgi:CheY-like chemotaxis protein
MAGKEKVLIVDDDLGTNVLVAKTLAKAGFETRTAFTADEALMRIDQDRFILIITDLRLPKTDGLELIARLAERGIVDQVPVMVLSAHLTDAAKEKARALGAVDFVSKPFDVAELQIRAKRAIERGPRAAMSQRWSRADLAAGGPASGRILRGPPPPGTGRGEPSAAMPSGALANPAAPAPPPLVLPVGATAAETAPARRLSSEDAAPAMLVAPIEAPPIGAEAAPPRGPDPSVAPCGAIPPHLASEPAPGTAHARPSGEDSGAAAAPATGPRGEDLGTSKRFRMGGKLAQTVAPPTTERPDCVGTLEHIRVAELVRFLHLSKRSGLIEVMREEERGEILMRLGEIVQAGTSFAGTAAARGMTAVREIFGWSSGRFRIAFFDVQPCPAFPKPTAALLVEAFGAST